MFARMSTILGKPERIEDRIRSYEAETIPSVKKMNGFKEAFLIVDRKTGKMVSITFWETEKDLQESTAAANKLRSQGARTAGTPQPPAVEVFEVAVKSS